MKRLEPIINSAPSDKNHWEAWVKEAYMQRINLSAQGFYATPGVTSMDWKTGKGGSLFPYFSYGAGWSEVEVDCLTGDFKVMETRMIVDAGISLNPAIDIGQVHSSLCTLDYM